VDVVEQGERGAGLDPQREDRLAERPGQGDLGEAPRRLDRFRAGNEHHGIAAVELDVQLPLPVMSGWDASSGSKSTKTAWYPIDRRSNTSRSVQAVSAEL